MTTDDDQRFDQTTAAYRPYRSPFKLSEETQQGIVLANVFVGIVVGLEVLAPFLAKTLELHSTIKHFGSSWWLIALVTASMLYTPPRLTEDTANMRINRKLISGAVSIFIGLVLFAVPAALFPAAS